MVQGRDTFWRDSPVQMQVKATPPTQLLQRHLERFAGRDVLVVGIPPDDPVVSILGERFSSKAVTFLSFDYASFFLGQSELAKSNNRNHKIIFSSWYTTEHPKHDLAIVYLQKGRELNSMILSMIRPSLCDGAGLFLVGENNAGIRSYRESLEQDIGPVTYSDAARHCVMYQAIADARCLQSSASIESWIREYNITVAGQMLVVVSLPGVFSYGRIDKGTSFLLEHMVLPEKGDFLDFGSGAGVIGAAVKLMRPKCTVTLLDSNVFAIESSNRTFARNGLQAHAIIPSNVFLQVTASYDVIISNPPFHKGIGTDYQVVTSFISDASHHLRHNGSIILVANRFLRYEPSLNRYIGPTTITAENQAYKVFVSRKQDILLNSPKPANAPKKRRK